MASARPSRRTRSWTTTTVAVAALALAGCSATNPITTAEAYNVVDGVQVEVGSSIAARSLLVFTSGEGEIGTLAGALTNGGREDVEVTVEPDGADAVTIDVPARGTVLLGGDGGNVIDIDRVAAPPGPCSPSPCPRRRAVPPPCRSRCSTTRCRSTATRCPRATDPAGDSRHRAGGRHPASSKHRGPALVVRARVVAVDQPKRPEM